MTTRPRGTDAACLSLRYLETLLQQGDLTLQAFVQKYGTIVLAAPTTSGFNRVAWIAPYMALVLGLAAAVVLIRGWKRPAGQPTVAGSGPGDAALDPFRKQARRETEL